MHKTIFALSTPPGKSGVAVVRISGILATQAFKAFGISPLPEPRRATLTPLRRFIHLSSVDDVTLAARRENAAFGSAFDPDSFSNRDKELIDHALVLYFKAPHSFTGEDTVELHCHGGRAVVRQVLDVLSSIEGYRMAEPGEFSRRAFLSGKMDLTAAEGVADLIDADTEAQHKQAVRIMQNAAAFYGDLRKKVLHALAFLEAYIDFPDEDIPEEVLAQIEGELRDIQTLIAGQLQDNGANERIREGFHIAILGAPNVGKSSLMNMLAGRDVAIVSSTAGTTRDVIEVQMDIKGYCVILADTAGIREQAEEIEKEGIRRSLVRADMADVRIVVLDAEEVARNEGRGVKEIENLVTRTSPFATIILINKSDLAPPPLTPINGITPIVFSVKERKGFEHLIEAIYSKISGMVVPEAMFVTRQRHRRHLEEALLHIENYMQKKEQGLELRCEELRRAATEVGRITGIITADEVLGEIFGSFCIGK